MLTHTNSPPSVEPPVSPPESDLALAYVGCVVPDETEFRTAAFSAAGNMFQKNFLLGMLHAGLAPSAVISARLLRSFPHDRRLWVSGGRARLSDEIGVDLVPYFNVTPLKQFTIGLFTFLALLRGVGVRGASKTRLS